MTGLPVDGGLPPRPPRVVRRRNGKGWLALAVVLLALVVTTVVWRLQRSGYFVVGRVQITGAQQLDQQEILNRAAVTGRRIYDVNTVQVAAAVDQIPMVKTATVRRIWPNTIAIAIEQRTPWGTWQIGGVNYLLDNTGTVIDIVSQPWPTNIYELDAAPGLLPGDHVDPDAVKIAQILVEQLPPVMSQEVAKLEYSRDYGLEIVTAQNLSVRIGDSQGLNYKLAVWQALNTKIGASRLHFIDLRSVDRPYYR
jgi:cell division septal protein FtsQ